MSGRFRAALATLASPPWRRAPTLLGRQPGVLAAVVGACAVMAAAASSVPLFVSSVGTAANQVQADERCGPETGATVFADTRASALRHPGPDPFDVVAAHLGPTDRWVQAEGTRLAGATPDRDIEVSLMARDDAAAHIDVLEGGGDGLWISDRAAHQSGLGVGDLARIGEADVAVTAVYRDLAALTVDSYWCSNAPLLLFEERNGDLVAPPPLVLVSRDVFADIRAAGGAVAAVAAWQAPLRPALDVTEAETLIDDLACHGERSHRFSWCRSGQPPLASGIVARDDAHFVSVHLRSALPFVVERTHAIQVSVSSGVWPVAAFATVAGVGLVVAASSLWFDRRRHELALLAVRGASPTALGVKAMLELLPALVVGPVLGFALAYAAVSWLGPSPVFEPSAISDAALIAAAAVVMSAITVTLGVALRARSHGPRLRPTALRWIPWEIGFVLLTLASYRRLEEWGVPVDQGADVSHVDAFGLLFPMLAMFSAVAVFVRLVLLALGPVRALTRKAPMPIGLAVRRVGRGRVATAGLLAAAAVAASVLGYAATMERSMYATLDTKATVFVGADTASRVARDSEVPAPLIDRSTIVQFQHQTWVDVDGRREGATLLAIDPDSFVDAAFWDESFADQSFAEVIAALDRGPSDGPIPAVVLGADVGAVTEVGITEGRTRVVEVAPMVGVAAFPGMRRAEVTVVVAKASIDEFGLVGRPELWVRGDHAETVAVLDAAGVVHHEARQTNDVADGAAFRTISWTFGFMKALGLMASLLVIGAVFVHLDARHRERLLAHAFLRRMGMSEQRHRLALAVELAASVLVGCWTGLAIAVGAAAAAHRHMDPEPFFQPSPVLRPAHATLVAAATVAVVLVVVGAALSQRRLERDDPVEVLRAGT